MTIIEAIAGAAIGIAAWSSVIFVAALIYELSKDD